MAKSAALNPASMPFFPAGIRSNDELGGPSLGYPIAGIREQDHGSMLSAVSLSPSEQRSVKSSPSPPRDGQEETHEEAIRFHQSPPGSDWLRKSPAPRSLESDNAYFSIDRRMVREASIAGSIDTSPGVDDESQGLGPVDRGLGQGNMVSGGVTQSLRQVSRTPSVGINNSRPFGNAVMVTSSSPVSSLGSGSHFNSNPEYSSTFEAQLRASPVIHDILDRLTRSELATRQLQRDVNDIHRKVDILVERSLGFNAQPEFKDPFASSATSQGPSPPVLNGAQPYASGPLAPNQHSDDINQISQRLNTLTTSVGQLLALQTQAHIQNTNSALADSRISSLGTAPIDVPPHQLLTPPLPSTTNVLGHGLPNRPDLRPSSRQHNPPMRTWSAGSLDLPLRPADALSSLGRSDNLLRDKRRSVSTLMRRDSAGVSWSFWS